MKSFRLGFRHFAPNVWHFRSPLAAGLRLEPVVAGAKCCEMVNTSEWDAWLGEFAEIFAPSHRSPVPEVALCTIWGGSKALDRARTRTCDGIRWISLAVERPTLTSGSCCPWRQHALLPYHSMTPRSRVRSMIRERSVLLNSPIHPLSDSPVVRFMMRIRRATESSAFSSRRMSLSLPADEA